MSTLPPSIDINVKTFNPTVLDLRLFSSKMFCSSLNVNTLHHWRFKCQVCFQMVHSGIYIYKPCKVPSNDYSGTVWVHVVSEKNLFINFSKVKQCQAGTAIFYLRLMQKTYPLQRTTKKNILSFHFREDLHHKRKIPHWPGHIFFPCWCPYRIFAPYKKFIKSGHIKIQNGKLLTFSLFQITNNFF